MASTVVTRRLLLTAVAAVVLAVALPAVAVDDPMSHALSGSGQGPGLGTVAPVPPSAPPTLHEASNDNFDAAHRFAPGALGFDLAEVTSPADLNNVPSGVRALVWLGRCDGATPGFAAAVQPYLNSPKVFGFYLLDEPDPNGRWKKLCPAQHLAAESDYLHQHMPGTKTFFLMMDLGMAAAPDYTNRGDSYTPSNTHIDLVGIDPYPCRSELHGCDLGQIPAFVRAATSIGWPVSSIVPVFQAFGGGRWRDDNGAPWLLPTADQAAAMLAVWRQLVPHPVFDQVYSWGSQLDDASLADAPAELQSVFALHNSPANSAASVNGAGVNATPSSAPRSGPAARSAQWPLPITTSAARSTSSTSVRSRRSAR